MLTGTMSFDGPAGRLEGIYRPPGDPLPGAVRRAAVVCHPHPQHGGTMHTKVVFRAGKAFERLGFAVLRFNFRGVGRSEGSFADGIGEQDDMRAALDWLAAENPGLPIVAAGFSFGSIVALTVGAGDERVSHLVGMGIPTARFPFDRLARTVTPKLFVQGGRDEHGSIVELEAGIQRVSPPRELVVVPDVDHFFTGKLPELERAIVAWFEGPAAG